MTHKTELQHYRLWTYDVWNGPDGPFVNDRFDQGVVTIRARRTVYNAGTPHEFADYSPTDLQLSRAVRGHGLTWSGESEYTLYAENSRGTPVCELERERS